MFKVFVILRKKAGLSTEDFHRYWKNDHAKVVSKLPGIVKYIQHHVMSYPLQGYEMSDAPIDGISETIWESQEAAVAASQTPEMMAVFMDEANFLDRSNHSVHHLIVTETEEIV
ncbi:MAG: EthD domain-containing protein [Chthoniobacteraceae bacterium]